MSYFRDYTSLRGEAGVIAVLAAASCAAFGVAAAYWHSAATHPGMGTGGETPRISQKQLIELLAESRTAAVKAQVSRGGRATVDGAPFSLIIFVGSAVTTCSITIYMLPLLQAESLREVVSADRREMSRFARRAAAPSVASVTEKFRATLSSADAALFKAAGVTEAEVDAALLAYGGVPAIAQAVEIILRTEPIALSSQPAVRSCRASETHHHVPCRRRTPPLLLQLTNVCRR